MEKKENTDGMFVQLLRRSEKFFKTDMVYVFKQGLWLSVGQAFALVSGLALSIIFAGVLPKEVYGNYKFVLTIGGLLSGLSLTGLGTVIVQAVARGAEGTLGEGVRTHLFWGGIVTSAGIVTALYYYTQGNLQLALGIATAGLSLPIIGAYSLYGSFLSGRHNFKANTLYWSMGQAINVLVMIVATLLTHNVFLLVLAYYLSQALGALALYFMATKRYKPNNVRDESIIHYAKHISVMNLFGTLANQLDKILVFHYLGAVELAVYTFAFALPEQLKGSFKNLFQIGLPKFAALSPLQLRKSILEKILRLTSYTVILVALYIFFSPFIFKMLFPRYLDSVFYSQIYSLGLLAIPGISLFSTYFQLRQQTRTLYKLNVIGNVATIILTFLLIKNFGLLGAVIENGLSWLILFTINAYYFATDKI